MADADFSDAHLQRLATLARLTLRDDEAARLRASLGALVGYVERLRSLDLAGIEPLTRIGDEANRLDPDTPGPTLPLDALRAIAPDMHGDFIRVPKVLGDGGGA